MSTTTMRSIDARPPITGVLPTDRRHVPASHLDLVECPPVAALTTVMPDGLPQTSVVWCDFDGEVVRVNTMRGFQKERNMRREPRVTLLCYDPGDDLRYLEVRGSVVGMTEDGALAHLDALASRYVGRPIRYFGGCVAASLAATEIPVLCRIRPSHVVALDARAGVDRATPNVPTVVEPAPAAPAAPVTSAPVGLAPAAIPDGRAHAAIPDSHRDLFGRSIVGTFTTMLPGGQPHSSLVWLDLDGDCPRVNTTLERQHGRDLLRDRRASLLVVDPADTGRFVQVRGEVELETDGAEDHLDELTRRYTRHRAFYGHVYPHDRRERETRVVCRLHPRRVTVDAIHH